MSDVPGSWRALSNSPAQEASLPKLAKPGRVVGLGAVCDLRNPSQDGRSQSFSVSEFVTLDDGQRVTLHADRGFTIGWGSSVASPGELREGLSTESITRDVLNVVLPDDDETEDDHPWPWLVELARARGLEVTEEDLRGLAYEVVLSENVIRWLDPATSA